VDPGIGPEFKPQYQKKYSQSGMHKRYAHLKVFDIARLSSRKMNKCEQIYKSAHFLIWSPTLDIVILFNVLCILFLEITENTTIR
jgi:hypothetical protein